MTGVGQSCAVGAHAEKENASRPISKQGYKLRKNSRRRFGGPGELGEQLLEFRQRRFGLNARVASLLMRKARTCMNLRGADGAIALSCPCSETSNLADIVAVAARRALVILPVFLRAAYVIVFRAKRL